MKPYSNLGLAFAAVILLAGSFAHAQGLRVKNAKLGGGRGKPGVSEALKQPVASLNDPDNERQQVAAVVEETDPSDGNRFPIYSGPPQKFRPNKVARSNATLPFGLKNKSTKSSEASAFGQRKLPQWILDLEIRKPKYNLHFLLLTPLR